MPQTYVHATTVTHATISDLVRAATQAIMFFIVTPLSSFSPLHADGPMHTELMHTIMLHPSYFGPHMQQYLKSKLCSDVKGTCSGQFSFIIAIVSISNIGKGMVVPGNGQAEFVTQYRAIVFKPFKGKVVDGIVHNITCVRSPHNTIFSSCHPDYLFARWAFSRRWDL